MIRLRKKKNPFVMDLRDNERDQDRESQGEGELKER